jgi:fibronectin type 3 domain-containing protein
MRTFKQLYSHRQTLRPAIEVSMVKTPRKDKTILWDDYPLPYLASWRLGGKFLVLFVCFALVFLGGMTIPTGAQQLTSGADFLRLSSGARGEAMGGAFTAVADDVNALTWNPAGLALLEYPEFGYLHMLYVGDTAYDFGGFAIPFSDGANSFGLGAGIVNLGVGSFDSTNGLAPPVSAADTAVFASGAYRFNGMISFGLTAKYIMRNIATYNAAAFAGDFGVLVTPSSDWRLGGGIFNVGQAVQFLSSPDPLPTEGRLGAAYLLLNEGKNRLEVTGEGGFFINSQTFQAGGGAEYWYDRTLALRAGYEGDANVQNLTAGIGLNLKVLQFDYAYAPEGTLGDTHRFSVIFRLGTDSPAALLAPYHLEAKPLAGGGAQLTWSCTTSADVTGYYLYLKRPGTSTYSRVTKSVIKETQAKLKSLKNGVSYDFAVASVSPSGAESPFAKLTFIPQSLKPAPPKNVNLTSQYGAFTLTWDKDTTPGVDVAGYYLYLADAQGKPARKLSSQPMTDNQVTLKNVTAGKDYAFLLTTVSGSGTESDPSELVRGSVASDSGKSQAPPPAPLNFTLVGGDAQAKLTWSPAFAGSKFLLYVSDDGMDFRALTHQPVSVRQATLKPLENGRNYYFAITSVAPDGQESEKSIQAVTPMPASAK